MQKIMSLGLSSTKFNYFIYRGEHVIGFYPGERGWNLVRMRKFDRVPDYEEIAKKIHGGEDLKFVGVGLFDMKYLCEYDDNYVGKCSIRSDRDVEYYRFVIHNGCGEQRTVDIYEVPHDKTQYVLSD